MGHKVTYTDIMGKKQQIPAKSGSKYDADVLAQNLRKGVNKDAKVEKTK